MSFFGFLKNNASKEVEGFENLQKRIDIKSNYLQSAFLCFSELSNTLKDFTKQIIHYNTKFTSLIKSPEEQAIHETCKLVYQKLINDLEQNNNLISDYISNFNRLLKKFNEEKNAYQNLKGIKKDLEEEKIKLSKNKEAYHKSGKEAEKKIKVFVTNNIQNLSNLSSDLKNELNNIALNPIKTLDNYSTSVAKVNYLITKYNNLQNMLYSILPDLGNEDGVFFFRLVKLYFNCLENCQKYLNLNEKQMNNSKTVESNSTLKILIEENENKRQYEKEVKLIQYQTDINFYKCKDRKEFDICANTIDTINKYINKYMFVNYDYQKALKNYEEVVLVRNLFEEKEEISEETTKKFLDSLDDASIHHSVFVILNQLGANKEFQKSKSLIKCLGKGFNKLLEYAEKNKLYDYAKDILMISQTYFYIGENKKDKIYLLEKIKNNKWLKNPEFWREFIKSVIHTELDLLEKYTNFPIIRLNIKERMTDEIKSKLNDVVFSKIMSHFTNMMFFIEDKKIVLQVVDEFIKKYDYLSDSNLNNLYDIISKDKEEIEKLRKEYSQNLKDNLIENDKNIEKEEKIKEEEKEKNQSLKENIENDKNLENKEEIKEEEEEKEKNQPLKDNSMETYKNIEKEEKVKEEEEEKKESEDKEEKIEKI